MSKQEFLSRLGALLADIPNDEKEEALRYYEDYFADAYDQQEEEVVEKLGAPEKIAKQIKLDLYNKASKEGGVYTESGYVNTYYEEEKNSPEVLGKNRKNSQNYNQDSYSGNYYSGSYNRQQEQAVENKNTKIILIVLLVVTSPIWASAAFGIIAGVGGALIGITFGTIGTAIGLGFGGIGCIIGGICEFLASPMAGVLLIGVGFMLVSLGLLCLVLFLLIVTRLIPWIVNVIGQLYRQIFRKGGR